MVDTSGTAIWSGDLIKTQWPTELPTSAPSAVPFPVPTKIPTPYPSPIPTPVPTLKSFTTVTASSSLLMTGIPMPSKFDTAYVTAFTAALVNVTDSLSSAEELVDVNAVSQGATPSGH